MKRKIYLSIAFLVVFSMIFSGCADSSPINQPKTTNELKVALVITDKLGDKSFFDASNSGLEKAQRELSIETRLFQCYSDTSIYSDRLTEASQFGSVVVVVGYEMYDLVKEISKGYPKVTYIYVDNVIQGIENINSLDFDEYEGAFLAGALAAMLTSNTSISGINDKKVIGMVGGMDIPIIRNFEAGYKDGAKYVDPEVEVITVFSGDFRDTQKCKSWTEILYQKDADIVLVAAGGASLGAFEAAEKYHRFVIGADSDQKVLGQDVVMASVVKEIGFSIFESIKKIKEGAYFSGLVYRYGLKENGVDLVYGDDKYKKIVPETVKDKIEIIKQKLVKGEIKRTAN